MPCRVSALVAGAAVVGETVACGDSGPPPLLYVCGFGAVREETVKGGGEHLPLVSVKRP
jgi:hypothetical protein